MRTIITIIVLELYAAILAVYQMIAGVRTDEAKYLLNIPYPHPPFIRSILGLLSGCPWSQICIRFVFASLLVQAVWLILGRSKRPSSDKIIIAILWLFSAAVILQAGSVMMAPLTAFSGLVLLQLSVTWKTRPERDFALVALFWLASLFTAYQAILFLPVVIAIFWRSKLALWKQVLYVAVPVGMLVLYTFANPFVLASMVLVTHKDGALPFVVRLITFFKLFFLSGSGILTVFGMAGLVLGRKWIVLLTLAIVSGYIFFSFQDYYGILFVPFFIIGVEYLLPKLGRMSGIIMIFGLGFIISFLPFQGSDNLARDTMQTLSPTADQRVLIVGSFGHEWQYYSPAQIFKYSDTFNDPADIVICLSKCPVALTTGKRRLKDLPVEAYQSL